MLKWFFLAAALPLVLPGQPAVAAEVTIRGNLILVDGQCPDAFHRFAGSTRSQVKAMPHQVALHAQVVGEAHAAAPPHLLQHHMQH